MPTAADSRRRNCIRRCIDSIRGSSSGRVLILAVVNGERVDIEILDWLRSQPDVMVERVRLASSPNAQLHGRRLVTTPYFSFLDDDDEYLPGSTDTKLTALRLSPDADLVVTNGFRVDSDHHDLMYSHLQAVPSDPLGELFRSNWLASCGALYRSSTIGPGYFENYHKYLEWTWLAFRLVNDGRRVIAVDQPCFTVHASAASLSRSNEYFDAHLSLYHKMLGYSLAPNIARIIKRRIGAHLHHQAELDLRAGKYAPAIKSHLRSLVLPGGLRYLTFSRQFIRGRSGWPANVAR